MSRDPQRDTYHELNLCRRMKLKYLQRSNELRSELNAIKSAINADDIMLILSENKGASIPYLAVQICEHIEKTAEKNHRMSEYMQARSEMPNV